MHQPNLPPISPEYWLTHLFSAKAARNGGIVRRKVRDVERILGRRAFENELHRRGFSAVENAGQFVIFCNSEPIRLTRNSHNAQILGKDLAQTLQKSDRGPRAPPKRWRPKSLQRIWARVLQNS